MLRILLVCLVFFAIAPPHLQAHAEEPIFEAFDAATLDASEKRLLQTALAVAGDYRGTLDGAWGPRSQAAIEAYAEREFGSAALNAHAAALVLAFIDEVSASGWDFSYLPDLDVSLALPLARLGRAESEEGGQRRWTDDGSLTVLTHRFDAEETQRWHGAAVKANARAEALFTERRPGLLVTRGMLRDGRNFFTRSERRGDHWATVFLAGEADQADAVNLAAASIRAGHPLPWDLPEHGRLSGFVIETEALLASSAPDGTIPWTTAAPSSPRAEPLPGEDLGGTRTGSGFYLGARTVVTAHHVVEGCTRVTLADGRALEVIASDSDLDVAALRAPGPVGHWLSLANGALRLGQQVHAVGFPYYSIAGTSLNLTTGNVSALAGVDDDWRFFTFSAPVQPGNSGGPLIDSRGAVRGLVVARLSEDYIAETTGSLPQNVNYALGEEELEGFLRQNAVEPTPGGLGGYDMADGAPAEFGDAVVPIVCH